MQVPEVRHIGTTADGLSLPAVVHSSGVVKLRRGETAKYVQQLRCMADLYEAFDLFASALAKKCASSSACTLLLT